VGSVLLQVGLEALFAQETPRLFRRPKPDPILSRGLF
jgi:hypothetical protein